MRITQAIIVLIILAAVVSLGFWFVPQAPHSIPTSTNEIDWESRTDPISGLSFQYPERLPAQYIHVVDWPPQIELIDSPFSCVEAGEEMARAGRTERRTIDGTLYCVTAESEGAAGSVYTSYAYATERDAQTLMIRFTTRVPQCLNYDEPQQSACQHERDTFDLDGIVDTISSTVRTPH
jgi:hypothetical protein